MGFVHHHGAPRDLRELLVVADQIVVRRYQHVELQQTPRPAFVVPDGRK